MDPNQQDWTPVVIRKTIKKDADKKKFIPKPSSSIKITQNEDGEEIEKLKTVSHEMAQFIIKVRVEKGLKQADLARLSCVNPKTITEIEKGGCIYNANIINKIAKTLGVNIPRK